MLALTLLACADPNQAEAPPSLDEYLHESWTLFATEDREGLGALTDAYAPTVDPADFPMNGTFSDLTEEEAALVEVVGSPDPALAAGFYLVDYVDCDEPHLVDALTNPDQTEVFPSSYEAYERTYDTDLDAFVAGDTDVVWWRTTYTVDIVFAIYTASIRAGAQRFPLADGSVGYATYTWAPEPAVSDDPDVALDQDFQIEVYWPGPDDNHVHAYGMWREFRLNETDDQDTTTIRNVIIDNMKKYFTNTSVYCQAG